MKETDYNKIAEIIEDYLGGLDEHKLIFINKLAEYFEEDDKENQSTKNIWNRKQFIKDCGVE